METLRYEVQVGFFFEGSEEGAEDVSEAILTLLRIRGISAISVITPAEDKDPGG